MKRILFKSYILLITLGLVTYGCADLEVINETAPDAQRALANPSDVMSLGGGAFRTWVNQIHEYEATGLAMETMADHTTCSWGNSGMKDLSSQDPITGIRLNSFNNSLTYSYFPIIRSQWQNSYAAISAVNLVLQRLYDGMEFGTVPGEDNALVEAFCKFVSGVSHGYLGLVFDQANIIPWDANLVELELRPYDEVVAAGVSLLDEAIAICNANTFVVPERWVAGVAMTNVELGELANAFAARILMSGTRTKAANEAIDWNQVLSYAQNGLSDDFSPEFGDAYDWYDLTWAYCRVSSWGRTDHRIINQMDHEYPSRWPSDNVSWNTPDGQNPGELLDPDDARLLTDFSYLSSNNFPPDRGYYHFSNYRYSRYDADIATVAWYGIGNKPIFMAWECRLIEAEAQFRLGNTNAALAILNDPAGPRKVRGQLPDVSDTDDVLRYILDEKDIECYLTGAYVPYLDMRRTDRLQKGTLLHFPVPATELEISELPHYTINAVPDGVDGSAGGWTGWDE